MNRRPAVGGGVRFDQPPRRQDDRRRSQVPDNKRQKTGGDKSNWTSNNWSTYGQGSGFAQGKFLRPQKSPSYRDTKLLLTNLLIFRRLWLGPTMAATRCSWTRRKWQSVRWNLVVTLYVKKCSYLFIVHYTYRTKNPPDPGLHIKLIICKYALKSTLDEE